MGEILSLDRNLLILKRGESISYSNVGSSGFFAYLSEDFFNKNLS